MHKLDDETYNRLKKALVDGFFAAVKKANEEKAVAAIATFVEAHREALAPSNPANDPRISFTEEQKAELAENAIDSAFSEALSIIEEKAIGYLPTTETEDTPFSVRIERFLRSAQGTRAYVNRLVDYVTVSAQQYNIPTP